MTPTPSALVETKGLTKRYGEIVAVDGLDLRVMPGEIYGLLGPNGAGKTTTILMLLGLTEPTEGTARVLDLDPAHQALDVKRRVGYLPDAVGFYGRLTGRENLRYTADLNGLDPAVAETLISELLEQVGLTRAADRPTGGYSRGMLQRLGIADALVKDPALLILDEPTTSIDPAGVVELLALIRALVAERGVGVLLSSHLLSQVQRLCDRVGIFWQGHLLAEGTPHDLARQAGDETLDLEAAYGVIVKAATEEGTDDRAA
ncbi:MAG: ABC transporter ATP-binding protein [Chloroflexi bacterium]|nr:ABC transporter ATP-binding protein [Chloroflexota bacterium]